MPFEFNPILRREVRVRWRGPVAFGLVFGYALLLALLMGLAYADRVRHNTSASMAATSHALFFDLTAMQMTAWLLLSPALTAAALAGEREQGMLELLQLTPLRPSRIAGGKLLSTLAFLGLMMLAPIPVLGMCFLMGGISPAEFVGAAVLQGATILCCASIGLCCSAWCRRASTAMGLSLGIIIAWTVGSFIKIECLPFRPSMTGNSVLDTASQALEEIARANPYYTVFNLDRVSWAYTWLHLPGWQISSIFQVILSALLFWSTTRALRKPLSEAGLIEQSKPAKAQDVADSAEFATAPTSRAARRRRASSEAQRGVWWESRLVRRLHFANPVLQREVARRLRVRRPPRFIVWLVALGALVVGYYYVDALLHLSMPRRHGDVWWLVSATDLILIILVGSTMGAAAFAREHETGTWEALQLSLLSPRQVIMGKLLPTLVTCWLCWAWLCPLLLPCVSWNPDTPGYSYQEISVAQAIGTVLITAATAWCYTCWGLLLSWRFRRAWIAIGATVASLIFALIMLPTFYLMSNPRYGPDTTDFLSLFHPMFGMMSLADSGSRHFNDSYGLGTTIILFSLGWVWIFLLHEGMRKAGREQDTFRTPNLGNVGML